MNYLVIYPGRFHPFHRGHRASYEYLAKKYGADHVYIATTGVQAPVTSPFTFADKVQMISTLGIPAGHVVKVSNPHQSREITDSIPSEEKAKTVLIFALSAKDAERFNFAPKRDGTASYLQPMPDNVKRLKPMTEHAYVEIVPTVNFKVRGKDANSASQIRDFYIKGNNNDRDQIIADLYGEAYPELRDIFDDRLGVSEQVQKIVREAKLLNTTKSIALIERILTKERRALNEFTQGMTEGREQITELRDRMYQYIKSIVPTWPDYVVKDWLYGNLARGETYNKEKGWSFETIGKGIPKILNDTGLSVNTTWQLVPNVKFTMDMWEPKTLKRLQARAGGSATSTDPMVHIPARDAERHATQAALAQQQGGVRKEPVIIVKTPQGYELLEGWHRTIQHFARYPNGYTGPAYVAVAQGQQGVAEGSEKHECPHCNGSGRMVRDPDIGTDQECFVCDGTGYVNDEQGVAEGESPANTLYFFDVGRGGRSFTNVDLRAMGLQQSQSGKWYYRPSGNSTPLLLKTTLGHLAKQLNVPPKPWQRPQTNEGIRDVLNFGIKKPTVKPAEPVDDFTAKMIANKQKNLKIVHPKDVYKSPDEYTRATGNKIKESADYLEEK